jgi:hypothetical protein
MDKDTFYLNRENLMKLGIKPEESIRAIQNKKAVDIHPYHVKILEVLKLPAVPSS